MELLEDHTLVLIVTGVIAVLSTIATILIRKVQYERYLAGRYYHDFFKKSCALELMVLLNPLLLLGVLWVYPMIISVLPVLPVLPYMWITAATALVLIVRMITIAIRGIKPQLRSYGVRFMPGA